MKKIIIFISSCSLKLMNFEAVKYAKSLGFDTAAAVDYDYNGDKITDYIIYSDTNNPDTLITDLALFNCKHEIAGILTYSDYHVEVTALVNQYFHLHGPSFESVQKCKNKFLCRMELNNAGYLQPKSRLIKNKADFKEALNKIGIPSVLKPMNGLGSAFTLVLEDKKTACQQFENLLLIKNNSEFGKNKVINRNWVLEECLEGFQISVESFTYKNKTTILCIHDKLNPILSPLFRVFYSATPSPRIDDELYDKISEKTIIALTTIGFDNGVSHTEFRISKERKIQLIEINARTGGGLIIPSAYYSTGVNLYNIAIDLALGKEPDIHKELKEAPIPVVFRVIYPPTSGRLIKFRGMDNIKNFDIIEQTTKEGEMIGEGQRLGLILKKGDSNQSIEELVKMIDFAVESLIIEIEPQSVDIPLPSHINNPAH